MVELMQKGKQAGWLEDPEKRRLLLLRRNANKAHRELRDACIFACLLRQALGHDYKVVPVREQANPADVFMLWGGDDGGSFCPVQLKELPPGYLNATASLDALLSALAADPPMPDTVVAIYLNRREHLGEFTIPPGLKLAGLWLYGATAPDSSKWVLIGDLLGPGGKWDLSLGI